MRDNKSRTEILCAEIRLNTGRTDGLNTGRTDGCVTAWYKMVDIDCIFCYTIIAEIKFGSVVKRLRHRPFTAVTRVRFPSESLTANFIVEISCGSFLQELPICQLIEVLYGDIAKR